MNDDEVTKVNNRLSTLASSKQPGFRFLLSSSAAGLDIDVFGPTELTAFPNVVSGLRELKWAAGGPITTDGQAWILEATFTKGQATEANLKEALRLLRSGNDSKKIPRITALAKWPVRFADPKASAPEPPPKPPVMPQDARASATPPTPDAPPADTFDRAEWTQVQLGVVDAYNDVDRQLEKLALGLRETGDADLADIANGKLKEVTGVGRVKLTTTLLEIGRAAPDRRGAALDTARSLLAEISATLDDDDRVDALDHNPLRIPVGIRARLLPALAALTDHIDNLR
jgi:hypothetical protein